MLTLGCPDLLVTVDRHSLRLKGKCLRFWFQIQFLPGKNNDTPDCMLRVYDKTKAEEDEVNLAKLGMLFDMDELSNNELGAAISMCHIASVTECCVSKVGRYSEDDQAITIPDIVCEGEKDGQYQALMKAVIEGFPEKVNECSLLLQPFHKCWSNISVVIQDKLEFLLYYVSNLRTRLVVPKGLRNGIQNILHADHRRDLTLVKRRAQEHVYWHSLNASPQVIH